MKCPHCNAVSNVLSTRATKQGSTRRRECFNGHRFTTHGAPADHSQTAVTLPLDLANAVLAWWDTHQHDTIGDRNTYDEDPPMVALARAISPPERVVL